RDLAAVGHGLPLVLCVALAASRAGLDDRDLKFGAVAHRDDEPAVAGEDPVVLEGANGADAVGVERLVDLALATQDRLQAGFESLLVQGLRLLSRDGRAARVLAANRDALMDEGGRLPEVAPRARHT